MKGSLQHRLFYSYIVVVVLVLVGVSVGISLLLRGYFLANKQHELVSKGYELANFVESYNAGKIDQSQFISFIDSVDAFIDARIWVLDANRQLVAVSTPPHPGTGWGAGMGPGHGMGHGPGHMMGHGQMMAAMMRPLVAELEPVFSGQAVAKSFHHPVYGEDVQLVAVPVSKADGGVVGAVILSAPVRGLEGFLQRLYLYIGALGLAALLLAFLLVRGLARGITRPLRDMEQAAAAMAHGDYATRVKVDSDDEVGELGRSLNVLAQELERFVAGTARMEKLRRDFIANISHELRTPLTVIRGYTEALLDGTVQQAEQAGRYHRLMRDETIRLEGLINELLDLSRLQNEGSDLAMEKVPLAAIAESVVTLLKPRADQTGISLILTADPAGVVRGNGDRLTQLLLILLDNALKFTPGGGEVKVDVACEGGAAVLRVADNGRGIAREDLPYIWERFYKADKSHSREAAGTGLGLAIAREIVGRHGAKAEVASELGRGTIFTITFPLA